MILFFLVNLTNFVAYGNQIDSAENFVFIQLQ